MKNAVTITMIFKASALNRDEKTGGNILTIKKLKRGDGKVYPFISRPAMRHYLWYTLWRKNPERWKPAEVKLAQNGVIQFDLRKGNAITSAELDLFGYMSTIKGETSITRKATLGITKAEGLEPYECDMGFYSNHGLVKRGLEQGLNATPDLHNKEEFLGFFKVSFTLDLERMGVEELPYSIDTQPLRDNEKWSIVYTNVSVSLPKGMEKGKEGDKWIDKSGKKILWKKGSEFYARGEDIEKFFDHETSTIKFTDKGKQIPVIEKVKIGEEEWFRLDVSEEEFREKDKKFYLKRFTEIPIDLLEKKEPEDVNFTKKRFKLKCSEKVSRIQDVLETLRDGLIYHSSTENYGIVPLFFAAAIVDIPIPVLHSYVTVTKIERDRFQIDKEVFTKARDNSWVKKIYVQSVFKENEIEEKDSDKFITNWETFLKEVLDDKCKENGKDE